MTLPFRRRHNDAEGAHDRARTLASEALLAPLAEAESTWLARHLEGCAECSRDQAGFVADRELLRALRDTAPEPPRDLWARTAAALDREAGLRPATGRPLAAPARRGRWGVAQLGAAAGALAVLVVVGVRLLGPAPVPPPVGSQTAPPVAVVPTPQPVPTPINVDAGELTWLRTAANGTLELVTGSIDEVCPKSDPSCTPEIEGGEPETIDLGGTPTAVTLSPTARQLVVESSADATEGGRIFVVSLSSVIPGQSPLPTLVPTDPPATPSASPQGSDGGPSPDPASPGPSATPGATPANGIEILSGVTVVGAMAYSEDGTWLAFSAQPSDGSAGPDLYLWRAGLAEAVQVTTDHRSYFAAWHRGQVLASRVELEDQGEPIPSGEPTESGEPGSTGEPGEPSASPEPQGTGATARPDPSADPSAAPASQVANPVSFLLDPASLAVTDLTRPDVWLPVVDATGSRVAYWSGTLRSDDGIAWVPDEGQLVLDDWGAAPPGVPGASGSPSPGGTGEPSPDPTVSASADPSAEPSAAPEPVVGPAGNPTPIVEGTVASFKASFDAEGSHLAVWVAEFASEQIGRLHLLVLDPETGAVQPERPLAGVPALDRFSVDARRLAWVSPSGVDGEESAVKVLAWAGTDFGEIQTFPARDLYIVD